MLVTFKTKAHADITMFGNIAQELLKLAGMTGNVPTAILAKDIPAVIAALERGLAQRKPVSPPEPPAREAANDDRDAEPPVAIGTRAVPLLALLRAASAAGADVMVTSSGAR
jgi:hypothetical protein